MDARMEIKFIEESIYQILMKNYLADTVNAMYN